MPHLLLAIMILLIMIIFFNVYPVRLTATEKRDVINLNSKHILSELDKASTSKANIVIKDYKFDTFKTDLRLELISKQFNNYDILSKQDFFTSYGLTITDKNKVINKSSKYILSQIDKASLEQATNLIKTI